jgi:hypothetical protein
MKTIIDAVNELQGDLSNVSHIKDDDTYHCNVNYNADSGWWCSRGVYGDFVCTINDFEMEVKGMSVHYARFDMGSLEAYLVADKNPLQAELVDGKAYQFESGECGGAVGWFFKAGNAFDCAGICFDAKHCTNIQPLTLENK